MNNVIFVIVCVLVALFCVFGSFVVVMLYRENKEYIRRKKDYYGE